MRHNFLNTPTPSQQRERLIWVVATCSTLIVTLLIIGCAQLLQLNKLWHAKHLYTQESQKREHFNLLVNREKELKDEISHLQRSLAMVTTQKKEHHMFVHALQTILSVLPEDSLQHLEFSKHTIQLTVTAPSITAIQDYIARFKKEPCCNSLVVLSIEQDKTEQGYTTIFAMQLSV